MNQENNQQSMSDNQQEGKDIVSGANNKDQLEKLNQAVPEGGRDAYPEKQAGTEPDAYKYERVEKSGDSTQSGGD